MTPALSLIQPWLSGGILRFGKRIENRTGWRSCKHRGPVWLHASAKKGREFHEASEGLRDALIAQGREPEWDAFFDEDLHFRRVRGQARYEPRITTIPLGMIVGQARIVGVVDRELSAWSVHEASGFRDLTSEERAWWFGGFALVLADVVELQEPVPCKGALGLWRVPEAIEAEARAALRRT